MWPGASGRRSRWRGWCPAESKWRSAWSAIPQFGPLVLVAAGGVLVELLHDRRLAFPPLDAYRASVLIDGLRIRPLLDGVRGAPPADLDSVVTAIVGLSVLAADLGEHLEALDANPVLAGPDGCVAVDALVIPRTKTAGT